MVHNTHNIMQQLRQRQFGFLPGSSIKTNAKIFGTAGAFIVTIFDTDFSTKLGYIAVPMSSRAPCFNKCLRYSFATKAVRMATAEQTEGGISPARFSGAVDFGTISLAVENLVDVMRAVDYGNNVMLFIGTEDSDFYGVKNCFIAPTLLADKYCKRAVRFGLQYIAYIRNSAYYRDGKRRIYGVQHNPSFALTTGAKTVLLPSGDVQPMGITDGEYPTTERSWYKLRAGWTPLYSFASGGLGQTYAMPFYNMARTKLLGVVA